MRTLGPQKFRARWLTAQKILVSLFWASLLVDHAANLGGDATGQDGSAALVKSVVAGMTTSSAKAATCSI
jgi:hypothetical protein